MCGIFGYSTLKSVLNKTAIVDLICSGLEKMQYRGYDSSGIFTMSQTYYHHTRVLGKESLKEGCYKYFAEKLVELKNTTSDPKILAYEERTEPYIGIGHNRWSTRGEVKIENAHPIPSDEKNQFCVVHNGIIDNSEELRAELIEKGYKFFGETDTEVAVKLLLCIYDTHKNNNKKVPFKDLVEELVTRLRGEYAFIFISSHYPLEMIATRRKSPLIMGIVNKGDNEIVNHEEKMMAEYKGDFDEKIILASDTISIVDQTTNLIYIQNEEIVEVNPEGFKIHNIKHPQSIKAFTKKVEAARLDGYSHFMEKEIFSQCVSIFNAQEGRIDKETLKITLPEFDNVIDDLIDAETYTFVGCGTSLNACEAVKIFFKEMTGKEIITESATRYLDSIPYLNDSDDPRLKIIQKLDSEISAKNINSIELNNKTAEVSSSEESSSSYFEKELFNSESASFESLEPTFKRSFATQSPLYLEKENKKSQNKKRLSSFEAAFNGKQTRKVMFFVSQSGETMDTLMVMNHCKSLNDVCIGITNVPSSQIGNESDVCMDIRAGVECAVASTKAYTSQIVNLMILALYINQKQQEKFQTNSSFIKRAKDSKKLQTASELMKYLEERRKEVTREIINLPSRIRATIDMDITQYLSMLNSRDSMVVIGRGFQTATCHETALKIKEVSYIHAEAISAGELKHGPLAMISDKQTVIAFIAEDKNHADMLNTVATIQSKTNANILFVTTNQNALEKEYLDKPTIVVPKTLDCLQSVINIIPMQFIAYNLALMRGENPDYPRHLAKSVTVR